MNSNQGHSFIVVDLGGPHGYSLRNKAAEFVASNRARGVEAGSEEEQTYGILAEMAIRDKLGLPEIDPNNRPIGYDIVNNNGVRMDAKCRSGTLPFKELYEGSGGILREAKHNFYARQVFDPRLDTDIYLMTHLRVPHNKTPLPGTPRQINWQLYVCGWVSKVRVQNEGVYLPRGSITEQGQRWFAYRSDEIEFYHKNLIPLKSLGDLLSVTQDDVRADTQKPRSLHMTSVDACRIAVDMVGRGILPAEVADKIVKKLGLDSGVPPFLHPNQYFHLARWLQAQNLITGSEFEKLGKIFAEIKYSADNRQSAMQG